MLFEGFIHRDWIKNRTISSYIGLILIFGNAAAYVTALYTLGRGG
jgi:hypothetical protein